MKISMGLLLLILLSVQTFAQVEDIPYSDSVKLQWSDFVGIPDNSYGGAALTHGQLKYDLAYNNGQWLIHVYCFFNPDKSWVIDGKQTDYLLKHEQLHFDIFELYARKMRKAITEADITLETGQEILNNIFKEYYDKAKNIQKKYDKETNHSLNEDKQKEWNESIASELKELNEYSSVEIIK